MRLALAAAFLVAACSSTPAAIPDLATSAGTSASGARLLYLTGSVDGAGLIPIDSLSLRDLSSEPLLRAKPAEPNPCGGSYSGPCALVTASADASALAVVGYSTSGASRVSVFDARSGALRARVSPEVPVIVDSLNVDGSRIFARNWPPAQLGAERLVLDAGNGKVLEREPAFPVDGTPVAWVIQNETRHLYALMTAADPRATGPREVEARAWDLRSGKELWRRDLPSLLAGDWLTGRVGSVGELRARLVPGIALSPDGRELAVVRAFDCCAPHGTLWLVDAIRGDLLSQRPYGGATSIFERLFAPSIALAKEDDEVAVNASFGADGSVLHVYSQSWKFDGRPESYQYLGMVAVEVASAKVLGSDVKMEQWWYQNRVQWVRPWSDGKWLYVFLERAGNADPKGYVLRRLDPRTLAVLAERRFESYRNGFVLAAP